MEEIGSRLRKIRKEKGLTLAELAGEEFTKGYLSQIERGLVTPSFKVLSHIAKQLEMDLAVLLEGDDGPDYQLARLENLLGLEKYQEALAISDTINVNVHTPVGVKIVLIQSKACYYLKQFTDCITYADKILTLDYSWSPAYQIEAWAFKAIALFEKQLYREAVKTYDDGIAFAELHGLQKPGIIARMHLNRAAALQNLEEYHQAISGYKKTLQYARQYEVRDTILDALIRLGYCYYRTGNLMEAEQYLKKGLQINELLELELPQAEALLSLSCVSYTADKFQLAEEYALQAYALFEKLNPTEPLSNAGLIEALILLIRIYRSTKQEKEAEEYFQKLMAMSAALELSSDQFEEISRLFKE